MHAALNALFHRLWTRAVGQPGYVKREWQELEAMIQDAGPPVSVWIVHEFEDGAGAGRLLSTTLYGKRADADRLADSLRAQPERRAEVRQQFVNP